MAKQLSAEAAIERFLTWLSSKGRATNTLNAYGRDLRETLGVVAELRGTVLGELPVADITDEDLSAAIAGFRSRPDARYTRNQDRATKQRRSSTVARRVSAVRSFFSWCYRSRLVEADPSALLDRVGHDHTLPKALPEATAGALADRTEQVSAWPERDLVIILLAAACGLRLAEIAELRLSDFVGSPPRTFVVRGKGGKERMLAVVDALDEALAAYLPTRKARLDALGLRAETLIISSRPRRVTGRDGRVVRYTVDSSRRAIEHTVDRVLTSLHVRRPGVRVHALRHTFATLALRDGSLNLRQLQTALGHASLTTTQIYTEITDEEIQAGMRMHPLGKRRQAKGQ